MALPNASENLRESGSGYALAMDGKVAHHSGVERGGDAVLAPGDGNNGSTTSDTYYVFADTNDSTATITLSSSDAIEGREIVIVDVGGNAGVNAITIDTEGSENIDGSASTTISTNNGSVRVVSDGTNWFTW